MLPSSTSSSSFFSLKKAPGVKSCGENARRGRQVPFLEFEVVLCSNALFIQMLPLVLVKLSLFQLIFFPAKKDGKKFKKKKEKKNLMKRGGRRRTKSLVVSSLLHGGACRARSAAPSNSNNSTAHRRRRRRREGG